MPPKKDAFADLFSSATNKSSPKANNLPLSERQKIQNGSGSSPMTLSLWDAPLAPTSRTSSPGILTPQRNTSNYPGTVNNTALSSNSSIGNNHNNTNKAGSNSGSGHNTPGSYVSPNEDPFAIFNKPAAGGSLLDDEFTDAFTAPTPAKVQNKAHSEPPRKSASESPAPIPPSRPKDDSRDEILAELIDIGFSLDDANEAILKKGKDLQACVNYIMSRGDPNTQDSGRRDSARQSTSRSQQSKSPDLGINFNELGQTMFSNANKFLSMSKKTVMKNLGQFQSHQEQSNVPAWMRTQEKYKSDAVEKKYGIGNEEEVNYGSDSENFDHEEIERIIRLQKEKEKERAKQRYEKVKEAAINKVRGKHDDILSPQNTPRSNQNSPRQVDENPYRKPEAPSRSANSKSSQSLENLASRTSPLPSSSPFRPNSVPVKTKSENPELRGPGKKSTTKGPSTPKLHNPVPTKEFDLLGISSQPLAASAHRVNHPLNQFEEVDYTTSKAAAHKAFTSGNYGDALESYLACLNGLPAKHENRVIILSNLAAVYKQLGQLKDSLERIEEGLGLMGTDEISSNASIAAKPVKYWYSKLITTKAEVLELLEKFEQSLENYLILIKELGVVDKKVMGGKRRVDKVVNPENYKVKPKAAPVAKPKPVAVKSPSPTAEVPSIDPLEQDRINSTIQSWAQLKQNNLRNLLTNLDEIIPAKIAMKSSLRHLTLNELMLPKQVKIQYMKVISSIHPDKLASQCKGDKTSELTCNGVFIILNKTWEEFKQENSM